MGKLRSIAIWLGKCVGGGLLSWVTPRLLVAMGVPLDKWIVAMAGWLQIRLDTNTALWTATAAIGALLYFGAIVLSKRHSREPRVVEPAHADAPPTPPVNSGFDWDYERNGPFIGITAGPKQQIRILDFQARSPNLTGAPLTNVRGYVRSDITNEKFAILLNDGHGKMLAVEDIDLIPAGATIDISAPFSEGGKTISQTKFLTEVVPFTFFFECDGKTIRQSFTRDQIEPRISAYEQEIRNSIKRTPTIAKRADPRISLMAAARRAYSDTQNSQFAKMAESRLAGDHDEPSPEETLLYYARTMARKMKIIGCKAPSDVSKEHDISADYRLEIEGDGIIARKRYGKGFIDHLAVDKSDLDAFIERVCAFPSKPL
jgi:hypothetical protein